MKALKIVISLISVLAIVAAAAAAIYMFRDSIEEFFDSVRSKCQYRHRIRVLDRMDDDFLDFDDI